LVKGSFFENSVIVTGASLGIGRQLALQLARQGAWLTLASRSTVELEKVAGLCREAGARAIAVTTDVADQKQCESLVERCMLEYGRIDTLVNNAGIGMRVRFDQLPDMAVLEKVMRTNYWGSVYCTYYALPHLKETKGRIVAVLSGGAVAVTPHAIGYGASKHALAGFFNTLRIELAGSGVSVITTYPVWVATGITGRALLANGKPFGNIGIQEQGAMPPEDCARQILKAAARRKRDMMPLLLRLNLIFSPIIPGIVDRIVTRVFTGQK